MTRTEAHAIVKRELEQSFRGSPLEPVILDDATEEGDFGWVFYYESRQYLETKNRSHRLAGNEPFVVDRRGRVHRLPTNEPPQDALQRLRDSGALNQP